MSTRANSDPT
ncbi:hypothetical protein LINGRAHAP2_LOCUS27144 [Linum grandiflorum]